MLTLTTKEISLQQHAANKTQAIKAIAEQLNGNGFVTSEYVTGMLNRENQHSTFLGNGIAIPHGTTDTRDLVMKTGVAIHHYPDGIQWDEGNVVYIVIGIAAASDEHLGILRQLTNVLSEDGIEEKLKKATTKDDIIQLLNGEAQLKADVNLALIQLDFPATQMLQLHAVSGGLLTNNGNVDAQFVADLMTKDATRLGNGLWLVSSAVGVKRTGMSIVTTNEICHFKQQPVKGVITIAACNQAHQSLLTTLSELVFHQQQDKILHSTAKQLVDLFTQQVSPETCTQDVFEHIAAFEISNEHGLHARPSAMLVALAKQYKSTISVVNMNGENKPVDAKNVMKVIGLGAKKGHSLKFIVAGADAKDALIAIEQTLSSGFGEE